MGLKLYDLQKQKLRNVELKQKPVFACSSRQEDGNIQFIKFGNI